MKSIEHRALGPNASIKEALEALNLAGRHLTVFVQDVDGTLLGTITDGDIRRALLAGRTMDDSIAQVMNSSPRVVTEGDGSPEVVRMLKAQGIRLLPFVDGSGKLSRVVELSEIISILPIGALIMAGGRGERLRPFTDTLPKPLIPVRGMPIIEHTLNLLNRHGVENVDISVNYLKERIIDHVGNGSRFGLHVRYVEEERPMGTAGALSLLKELKYDVMLMMNSDLLTDVALDEMYARFITSDADMVVATTEYVVDLPYAVMDVDAGRVLDLREKPTVRFPCNAGIYMIHRRVIDRIPKARAYNATDLIKDLLLESRMVMAFPINGYWYDIGQHEDLERAGAEPNSSGDRNSPKGC